jgi:hypothetical protein
LYDFWPCALIKTLFPLFDNSSVENFDKVFFWTMGQKREQYLDCLFSPTVLNLQQEHSELIVQGQAGSSLFRCVVSILTSLDYLGGNLSQNIEKAKSLLVQRPTGGDQESRSSYIPC